MVVSINGECGEAEIKPVSAGDQKCQSWMFIAVIFPYIHLIFNRSFPEKTFLKQCLFLRTSFYVP